MLLLLRKVDQASTENVVPNFLVPNFCYVKLYIYILSVSHTLVVCKCIV